MRWLDRAHRLLPDDPTIALTLAEALLGTDSARAARIAAAISDTHDVREVWLLLAAARYRAGDAQQAAEALRRALSGHAISPGLAGFAEAIAGAAGFAGWCGLGADLGLLVGPIGLAVQRGARPDGRLEILHDGVPLLGSPVDPQGLIRTEGFVEQMPHGALQGWAWMPRNPERAPVLTIRDGSGAGREIVAEHPSEQAGGGLLVRRRRFLLAPEALAGLVPPVHVLAEDGKDLLGSPLPSGSLTSDRPGAARTPGRRPRARNAAVIVPVHGGGRMVLDCLRSVQASLREEDRLIVIEDGAPEPNLSRRLQRMAGAEGFELIRHETALGFPAAANAGLQAADEAGCDAVLLNSDTLVPPGWIEDLQAVAYAAPDIGTVTPFSNAGAILSYPGPEGSNPMPDLAQTRKLAAAARAAGAGQGVEIPVGVGFCLYIRRDCLRATGRLRTDLFSQGYGEENDFCLRATAGGWRHMAAVGTYVAHRGGASMGAAAADLRRRNAAILERLHPGYHAQISAWIQRDPLGPARRAIDLHRWHARHRRGTATAIVTHDQGGGVERAMRRQADALAEGERVLILRPASKTGVRIEDLGGDTPNLVFALPQELDTVLEMLKAARVRQVVVHHLLGHHGVIRDLPRLLGVPHSVHVHDFAWLCPRVLLLGAEGRYCGEPDLRGCARCIRRAGSFMDDIDDAGVLRTLNAPLLARASRVVVPSQDTAARMARYFPEAALEIVPHEGIDRPVHGAPVATRVVIAVIGAIGPAKGYDVLLAMARDVAKRGLPLSFVVVGHTTGDNALMETGRVFVTGPFAAEEAEILIRAQRAALAFIPSVVPETWCYALSDAWRAGLAAVAFDLGAQAERIRRSGRGIVVPLCRTPRELNDALLAACAGFRHESAAHEVSTGP